MDTSAKSIIQTLNSKDEQDTQNADSTASDDVATTIDTALGNTMVINDTETG